MNFSGYFVLAAAVVLVIFAQQSYAESNKARQTYDVIGQNAQDNLNDGIFYNATVGLLSSFYEGLRQISKSEETIRYGISDAKLDFQDPEAANKTIQEFSENAKKPILDSGTPFFQGIGEAVNRSNEGARQGLEDASVKLQKGGLAILDNLNAVEYLSNQGISAGGRATQVLIECLELISKIGYAAAYNYIQESSNDANDALRDAQSSPAQRQVGNKNCESVTRDRDGSDALNDINEAANNALTRGANPELVQKLIEVLKCSLSDLVKTTAEARRTIENFEIIIETDIDSSAIRNPVDKLFKAFRETIHNAASRIYSVIGDIALESGNQSNKKIGQAITVFEVGKIATFSGLTSAEGIIVTALKYPREALIIALRAAARIFYYGELAFIQGIVKGAKLILSVL